MNREQLIEKAAVALFESPDYLARKGVGVDDARTVLDAVLPQVSTVAELEALPFGTKLIDFHGDVWWAESEPHRWWSGSAERGWPSVDVVDAAPLTVVWLPEVTR